jgi:hypothetical protein
LALLPDPIHSYLAAHHRLVDRVIAIGHGFEEEREYFEILRVEVIWELR